MKTEDLIKALTSDAASQAMPLRRAWWLALGAATVVAAIVFLIAIGPRPDFAAAAHTIRFLFKFVMTLLLVALAFALLQTLSRPDSDARRPLFWLVVAPVVLGAAVVIELLAVPPQQWRTVWWGTNISACLTFIPVIGIAPLALFLLALRHGAPTRPRLAGTIAGLLAGGVAATFYAAHCTDDSPLFVATWYSIAIAGLALLGMILGPRVARW